MQIFGDRAVHHKATGESVEEFPKVIIPHGNMMPKQVTGTRHCLGIVPRNTLTTADEIARTGLNAKNRIAMPRCAETRSTCVLIRFFLLLLLLFCFTDSLTQAGII